MSKDFWLLMAAWIFYYRLDSSGRFQRLSVDTYPSQDSRLVMHDPSMNDIKLAIIAINGVRKSLHILDAWEIFASDLSLGELLGSGKFGEVFKATWKNHTVAVKTMREESSTEEGKKDFLREADIMKVSDCRDCTSLNAIGVSAPECYGSSKHCSATKCPWHSHVHGSGHHAHLPCR